MSKLHLAAALSCALALSACVTAKAPVSGGGALIDAVVGALPTKVSGIASAAVADIRIGCGYVADESDLIKVVSALDPTVATAAGIATTFCDLVRTQRTASRGSGKRTIGLIAGVPVRGRPAA